MINTASDRRVVSQLATNERATLFDLYETRKDMDILGMRNFTRKVTRSLRWTIVTRTFLLIALVFVILSTIFTNVSRITDRCVVRVKNVMVDGQQLGGLVAVSSVHHVEGDPPKNLAVDPSRGFLDKTRQYKTHHFVTTGDLWAKMADNWRVCLSTQTSSNFLFNIALQSATWMGPMSVSVFVPAEDYTVSLKMIQYLRKCFPAVRERATFHLTYPNTLPPKLVPTEDITNTSLFDCNTPEEVNKFLVKKVRSEHLIEVLSTYRYPQNILRNVARGGCQSEYIFTPDVDMISIPAFSYELNEFLGRDSIRSCIKCAFILPIYEISVSVSANPKDKTELLQLVKTELAQPFHIQVFKPNQNNSHLERWEEKDKKPYLDVLYKIETWQSRWEPIYVAKGTHLPPFDERFVGYGSTRNTQVYEMRVAGYTWHMLNNAFLTHRGLQTSKIYSKDRMKQILANYKKWKVFEKELYARYEVKAEDFDPLLKTMMEKEAKKKEELEEKKCAEKIAELFEKKKNFTEKKSEEGDMKALKEEGGAEQK